MSIYNTLKKFMVEDNKYSDEYPICRRDILCETLSLNQLLGPDLCIHFPHICLKLQMTHVRPYNSPKRYLENRKSGINFSDSLSLAQQSNFPCVMTQRESLGRSVLSVLVC